MILPEAGLIKALREKLFAKGNNTIILALFDSEKKKNKISNNEEFDPGSG